MPTIQPPKEGEPDVAEQLTSGEIAGFGSFLMTHNIGVTLTAFALGITLGIGTAWLMFYNGVTTGALAAVFYDAGAVRPFAAGILPHGVVEIPAMLIGGAAGSCWLKGCGRQSRGRARRRWLKRARKRCSCWPASFRC